MRRNLNEPTNHWLALVRQFCEGKIIEEKGRGNFCMSRICVALKGRGFAPFWSENGYRFCPFWSGLRRNYGCVSMCSSFQFQMTKKGGVICKFKMEFEKSFCCGFYLSNDDIISLLCKHVMLRFVTTSRSENGHGFQRPGLKTGVEIDIFVCNRVRRTGRHTPTTNSQECPLPPPPRDVWTGPKTAIFS